VSNLHKSTLKSFVERCALSLVPSETGCPCPPALRLTRLFGVWLSPCSVKLMYNHKNPKNGMDAALIADDVYEVIMKVGSQEEQPGRPQHAQHVQSTFTAL